MERSARHCKECHKPIYGRSDKQFCSDACRGTYNYRKRCVAESPIRKTHKQLRKNYRLLKQCIENKEFKPDLAALKAFGYHPNFHTQSQIKGKNKILYSCYDITYERRATELEIIDWGGKPAAAKNGNGVAHSLF